MKQALTKSLVLAIVGVGIMAGNAAAVPMLDFAVSAPTPGTLSYAGGNNPLIGSKIQVDTVVGLGTSLNNNISFNLIDAELNFTTGAGVGPWKWGGGPVSSISIIGGIDTNNDNIADLSGTLLSGTFGTAAVTYSGNMFHIVGGGFSDFKLVSLLDLYGLPRYVAHGITPLAYNGNFNISFTAPYSAFGDVIASEMLLSGDITNSAPVPEPATMLLFGTGLAGFAGMARRRLNKKATGTATLETVEG